MTPHDEFKAECGKEISEQGDDPEFKDLSRSWMTVANRWRYSYHFEWLGRPVIQYPQDLIALQEIVYSVRPNLIIETGIAHGGSLLYSASLLALLDMCDVTTGGEQVRLDTPERKVIGVDIDIRAHNRRAIEEHPMSSRIQMIEGSSTARGIIDAVSAIAQAYETVLVLLDSNHSHDHVYEELVAYSPLVSVGSYCIVYDTVIEFMDQGSFPEREWNVGDNPYTAVQEFLRLHPEFEVDESFSDKLQITVAPGGYLRRLR